MNNQEAKFILEAYRPDGRDASDAQFAAAIAQAERDPELRVWWDQRRAFDTTLASKLQQVMPPPGLRESILAGGRASQPRRHWWSNPLWYAAAASMAVLITSGVALKSSRSAPHVEELASVALKDVSDAHSEHTGWPAALASVQGQLVRADLPFSTNLTLDLDDLRRKSCRTIRVRGREVFEICFQRDGTWFHLYAARREDFRSGQIDPKALLTARGDYASTAWADAKNVYALVTSAGAEVLRRSI